MLRQIIHRARNLVLLCGAMPIAASAFAAGANPEGLEFFEKRIRPVLVDNCYQCHSASAEKLKGGLLLDTRDAVLKGGDTGPAIVPGNPEKSLLIKAVRYTDENLQMPPKDKKLTAQQIADLESWVKMGAPDPRSGVARSPETIDMEQARKHWAFQPIAFPEPPAVKDKGWPQTPLDHFVLAKLESKKLSPSPRADKRTLIRRASYDLIGLPPSAEEVAAFIADKSPDAFPRLVDRLLASPRYGERWGRYWLDIARYADTKGYVFEEERRYPFAYTYRDYVVRALNEDLPYDQFIIQQLAADALPLGDDKRALAALGFLTLGRRFLNNQPDIIDDRIDLVTRGLMGLTVSCARCHDHKFDPVPTKDYYSLYGVFASSEEPGEKPLLGAGELPPQYPEYLAEKKKRDEESKKFREEKERELMNRMRSQVGEYLLAAHDTKRMEDQGKREALARERKLAPNVVQRWRNFLDEASKETNSIFSPWLAYSALSTNDFVNSAGALAERFVSGKELNPLVAVIFTNAPSSLKELAERYGNLFSDVDKRWRALATNSLDAFPEKASEGLRQLLYADSSPLFLESDEMYRLFDTPAQQRVRALRRRVDELDATHAGAPPRAMALLDRSNPIQPVVFVRGNPGNRGAQVPRQFLEILSGHKRQPFGKGSGRLELAQAIASTNNPLTARVLVNRVWLHHFGTPLVRTPSDFGVRSEPPTHPELLDYLASRFMAEGWSLKKLHRLIMLSAAYQQSSEENAKKAKIDPANEWFWRMNRQRLDFEAMRDTLLAASGKLDLTMGGHAVDITTQPFTTRRTVYAFIERQNLPGVFRTFDFASPDTSSSQRFYTSVPQQALFLMNSPFVIEQAKHLLERPEIKSARDEQQRVEEIYRVAYQRAPQAGEVGLAKDFLKQQARVTNAISPQMVTWQYGFGEIDETAARVKEFRTLPHFTGSAWQGSSKLPDEKLGWVMLNAEGGHVGNDARHAAIRRWTAPRDGVISIKGRLGHAEEKGDGVRGRIVVSRSGVLGEWIAHNTRTTTNVERVEVKRGDTVDFVADLRANVTSDSFTWAPTISYAGAAPQDMAGARMEWNAKGDFSGAKAEAMKPLTAWEKYAQVLLLSNEMMFVD